MEGRDSRNRRNKGLGFGAVLSEDSVDLRRMQGNKNRRGKLVHLDYRELVEGLVRLSKCKRKTVRN
jgi:hypothetical protein